MVQKFSKLIFNTIIFLILSTHIFATQTDSVIIEETSIEDEESSQTVKKEERTSARP